MAAAATPLGRRLDAEWHQLVTSPAATGALTRWGRLEPEVAGQTSLEQLRGTVHNRADLDTSDRVLAALVRLAAVSGHGDPLATRVVLQLLLPGAVRLAQALAPMLGGPATSEAMVLAEVTIGVRTYPWQRRPRRVAANLLLDARQRLTRATGRAWPELPVGLNHEEHPLTTPAGKRAAESAQQQLDATIAVEHLLWWAQRRKVINAFEAQLLRASYGDEIPMNQLAKSAGRSRSTLFAMRAGAEQRLRQALTAADPPPADGRVPDLDEAGRQRNRLPGPVPAPPRRQSSGAHGGERAPARVHPPGQRGTRS